MNGGELFTHLYQRDSFTEDEVKIYIGEIILALETLHKVSYFFFSSFSTMNAISSFITIDSASSFSND